MVDIYIYTHMDLVTINYIVDFPGELNLHGELGNCPPLIFHRWHRRSAEVRIATVGASGREGEEGAAKQLRRFLDFCWISDL